MNGRRGGGCVTNFEHGDQKLTIWDTGNTYRLSEFGVLGKTLSLTDEPLFQSIAKEMQRLACEVGRLRRAEIEAGHERSHLREKVEAMERRTVPENKADGWKMACAEVLALLDDTGSAR
jgi:hypothetical protein